MAGKRRKITSPVKQKVISLLLAGVALSLSSSRAAPKRIFKALKKDWQAINRRYLYHLVDEFYNDQLVDYKEREDGTIDVILSRKGKEVALSFQVDRMQIKRPARWDGKWRVVFFDVPEKRRARRDALRDKLKDLGFLEWQKSVWVFPYPCTDEIDFIAEFFEVGRYVRHGEITCLNYDADLRLHFKLL